MPPDSRFTLGVLVPYFNSAVEPELAALRPAGVTHQTARFALDAQVIDDIVGTAEKLSTCGTQAFLIGLATDSFPNGLELLRQGMTRLADATGQPVYAPSFAAVEALRAFGAETVGVVTPFDAATNVHVRGAIESQGFRVAGLVGLARPGFDQIANTPQAVIRDAFERADGDDVQALLQIGTGLPVVSLVAELEQRFGKPVVASNPVVYWQALRGCGVTDRLSGFGRLLAEY